MVRGGGREVPPVEEMGNFAEENFLLGGGNPRKSDFDHLNLKTSFCKY